MMIMDKLKIGTFNVNGWRENLKRRKMFKYLHEKEFDVICIQETHATREVEKRWRVEWGSRVLFANGTSQSKGVCILFKRKLRVKVHFLDKDSEGRFLIADLDINDTRYTLTSLYAPNEDHPAFFVDLFQRIEAFHNENKLTLGDFNLALTKYDKDNIGNITFKKSAEVVNNYMKDQNVVDIWRFCNPERFRLTWRSGQRKSRIDYILIPQSLVQMIEDVDILPAFITDHSLPVITLLENRNPRGKGYWKLNSSLLRDGEYVEIINQLLELEFQNFEFDTLIDKWEYIKMQIRSKTIEYSVKKKREMDKTFEICEKKLKTMEEQIDNFSQNEMNETIKQIQEINAIRTKGAIIRSKATWLAEGELPSKYFLSLEKQNYNRKTLKRLKLEDGTITQKPSEILDTLYQYYQNLYTSHFDQEFIDTTYLDKLNLPQLKDRDFGLLESPLTKDEIQDAIKTLKPNKSPGIDGIPAEFYQFFWNKLHNFLFEMYQEIILEEQMNSSATEGLLTLIDKPDKDPIVIPNWRPLTLLTVDYKILAKIIANRVSPTLSYLIHPQQTGFIKNRHISDNLMDLLCAAEYCYMNDLSYLIVNFDMQKAFDKVEWPALWAILNKFGFGPKILSIIRILYKDATRKVINNGYLSKEIKVQRSTAQGCPWSPLAYALLAEPLGAAI